MLGMLFRFRPKEKEFEFGPNSGPKLRVPPRPVENPRYEISNLKLPYNFCASYGDDSDAMVSDAEPDADGRR